MQTARQVAPLAPTALERTEAACNELVTAARAGGAAGEIAFTLVRRAGKAARPVRQELRVQRVCLNHAEHGPSEMTCLISSEIDTPAGSKPICW